MYDSLILKMSTQCVQVYMIQFHETLYFLRLNASVTHIDALDKTFTSDARIETIKMVSI